MAEEANNRSVAGRVAVVTGAASGMGRWRPLGAEGARVAALDRNGDGAAQVADAISLAGGIADAGTLDVADAAEIPPRSKTSPGGSGPSASSSTTPV